MRNGIEDRNSSLRICPIVEVFQRATTQYEQPGNRWISSNTADSPRRIPYYEAHDVVPDSVSSESIASSPNVPPPWARLLRVLSDTPSAN